MKKFITLFILSFTLLTTGCATIVSKSKYDVNIQSKPSGAHFIILNKLGNEVARGVTPKTVKLKAGAGYFKPEKYKIIFSGNGIKSKTIELEAKLDGWYMGNILLLSPLGALIIDPITGAMYKLPNQVDAELEKKHTTSKKRKNNKRAELFIMPINELNAEQVAQLSLIK